MSFRCGICNEMSKPREKAFRVITETRMKQYPARPKVHIYTDRDGATQVRDDPGGVGQEIVKEVLAHERCAKEYSSRNL